MDWQTDARIGRSLEMRHVSHSIINNRTILLRPQSIRRGDGRRNRLAARDRTTTIGPKRHQLNTIWHRVNTKSASNCWHHFWYADILFDTLTSFLIRRCHSWYADVILNTLKSFSICWCHSHYVEVILDTLTQFPTRRCHSGIFCRWRVIDV